MRHGGVAGHRDLLDVVELDAVTRFELVEKLVNGLDGEMLQARQAAFALGVDDARDHVVAAGDLLVVGARGVYHPPAGEVDQVDHHRCGAQVDGQTHYAQPERARIDADETRRQVPAVHPVAHLEGHADLPVGHAQVAPQTAQHGQLGAHLLHVVLLAERSAQAVEVARVVGQRGRVDVYVEGAHRRVLPPVTAQRQRLGLGDGMAVRPHRLTPPRGYLDLDRPHDERLAGDRPAGQDLGGFQAGVAAAFHLTRSHAYPAAAAAALPGAGRRQVELAQDGGVEQAGARRHLDALPGGSEGHLGQRGPGRCCGGITHACGHALQTFFR